MRKVELFQEEVDVVIVGLEGPSSLTPEKTACLQRPHSLVALNRQEIVLVFVCRVFIPTPERNKLCQHLLPEGTLHLTGMMASGAT